MTEKEKRAAIILTVGLVAILLLLWFRRGGARGAQTVMGPETPFTFPGVALPNIPGIDLGDWTLPPSNGPIIIPGLDFSGPDLSMIGACCSDCMQTQPTYTDPQPIGPTYVINQGNAGPNVYNYTTSTPTVTCPYMTYDYGDGICRSPFGA